MSAKTGRFFVAVLIIGVAWFSLYSYARSKIIAYNKECGRLTPSCPLKVVPRTIWEMITDVPGSVGPAYVPARFGPSTDIPCDQSATTTPCSVINNLQPALPVPEHTERAKTFAFGELVYRYIDESSGFSFRYPAELTLVERQDTCPYLIDNPDAKSPLFVIQTPSCSTDATYASIDEYKNDFTVYGEENTKLQFHLLTHEDVTTQSGIAGLLQVFSLKTDNPTDTYGRVRYVFKLPQKGFLIFLSPSSDLSSTYYSVLERAVTESITFP